MGPVGASGQGDVSSHPSGPGGLGWRTQEQPFSSEEEGREKVHTSHSLPKRGEGVSQGKSPETHSPKSTSLGRALPGPTSAMQTTPAMGETSSHSKCLAPQIKERVCSLHVVSKIIRA